MTFLGGGKIFKIPITEIIKYNIKTFID